MKPNRLFHSVKLIPRVRPSAAQQQSGDRQNEAKGGVDIVTLEELKDFEADGAWLEGMIEQWLNEEWMVQACHKEIGQFVNERYIAIRKKGLTDLGEILIALGTDLTTFDMKDAFVGGWDVANKASDLLILRMNRELCSCAGDFGRDQKPQEQGESEKNAEKGS
eukprot:gnl/MRDRNA2_/MRDRNA2_32615_c0_seq2.p1 gnl/MRDRNA2_/MRDRNA2_32615_c0~~gnl/MRDRNA2_/MRDRNA2_32615_c0_seq2.p1  ORF type:complete len:188 (+),score=34.03 gnl/MRDRNA2_/MRDRNA2_32615_c0_seq2:74-565(+)